jgi:hypothetical protein
MRRAVGFQGRVKQPFADRPRVLAAIGFPWRSHRTMAEVLADEARVREVIERASTASPAPDDIEADPAPVQDPNVSDFAAGIQTAASTRAPLSRGAGCEGRAPDTVPTRAAPSREPNGTSGAAANASKDPANARQARATTPRPIEPLLEAAIAAQIAAVPTDYSRFVKVMREKPAPPAPSTSRVLAPALSREECRRCGVPGFRGCEHQAPYDGGTSPPVTVRELPLRYKVRTC